MGDCDRNTNNDYLADFITMWKRGSRGMEVGFNCIDGRKKNKINLLDFISIVVKIKQGGGNLKVSDWCSSCTTIRATEGGYLTVSGALNLDTSTSDERPIYFFDDDVENLGNLSSNYLDLSVKGGEWTNRTWPNVIVKSPADDIRILDVNGNPASELKIRTIPIPGVTNLGEDNNPTLRRYYYLFVENPNCSNLPLPVYQYSGDSGSESTNPNGDWRLVSNMGTPVGAGFDDCPENCDQWDWKSNVENIKNLN